MTKIQNLWLMAALVCGLSLFVTSCKDNEDIANGGTSAEQQQEAEAKAEAAE